jgi:hypothetical protein
MGGVTDDSNQTPVMFLFDPVTGRLKVMATLPDDVTNAIDRIDSSLQSISGNTSNLETNQTNGLQKTQITDSSGSNSANVSGGNLFVAVQNQVTVENPTYDTAYEVSGNYIYLGESSPGTATSASSWRIQRVDTSTGYGRYADADPTFNKAWDDRASYTY